MKMKKLAAAAAGLFLSVSMACTAYAGSWEETSGGWKYRNDGGGYAKGRWVNDGGNWYYIERDGYMRTGWMQDNGNWYYLGNNGAMLKGVTVDIGGTQYSFDENGAMMGGDGGSQPQEGVPASQTGGESGWNGVTYTSRRLDFQLTVPEGFIDVKRQTEASVDGAATVELSASAPDNTVAVVVACFPIPSEESDLVTADGMARSMKQDFETTGRYSSVGEVSETALGGYRYSKLPMSYLGMINQDLYFRRAGEELIMMQLVYEPGHQAMVDGILASMKRP